MRALTVLILVLLGAAVSGRAQAATFSILPVTVALGSGQTSAALTVRNDGPDPLTVQVRIFRWTQSGDEDLLTPTSDIVLSPPVATIPAGGAQTLRLLLRAGPAAEFGEERHYRVLLDEIPAGPSADRRLSFAVRASLPVFVLADRPSSPQLRWGATRGQDGAVLLSAFNAGGAYDRVVDVVVTALDGTVLTAVPAGSNPYVLPHTQRYWRVTDTTGATGAAIRVSATTRAGKSVQVLPIDP